MNSRNTRRAEDKVPKSITVPAIHSRTGELVRAGKTYHIGEWRAEKPAAHPTYGMEAEGKILDHGGSHLAWDGEKFAKFPTGAALEKYCRNAGSVASINAAIAKMVPVYRDRVAKVTEELYKPDLEISMNGGHAAAKLFRDTAAAALGMMEFAEKHGGNFHPVGYSPFAAPDAPNLSTPYARYLIGERDGSILTEFRGAALQLHAAMEDVELAIFAFNGMRHLAPLFLALSANSPFRDGRYGGHASERTLRKRLWLQSGTHPAIDGNFFAHLQEYLDWGVAKSATPHYHPTRLPRVDIPTIEMCSADSVDDLPLTFALADLYFRSAHRMRLAHFEKKALPKSLFGIESSLTTKVLDENLDQAARFGTRGQFVVSPDSRVSVRSQLERLFEWIDSRKGCECMVPAKYAALLGHAGSRDFTREVLTRTAELGNPAEMAMDAARLPRPQDNRNGHVRVKANRDLVMGHLRERLEIYKAQARAILGKK